MACNVIESYCFAQDLFISEVKADFETNLEDFELFWYSKPINTLRSLLSLVTKLTFL
jgi:hypothetical protein